MTEHSEAPADVAPELAEASGSDGAEGSGSKAGSEGEESRPLPHVPDAGDGSTTEPMVPPVSNRGEGADGPAAAPGHTEDAKPIRYYKAETERGESGRGQSAHGQSERKPSRGSDAGDTCGCDGCGCGSSGTAVTTDGGATPANVDSEGTLRDVDFTDPAAGVSQDVEEGDPTERVNPPEGVDLDTPDYAIRDEMNDIDTPDEKTWFMELDEAVVGDGRCIQCGTCVAACPSDSIGIGDDGLPELVKMCTGCSLCWDFCPRGGLRYERQWKITGGDDNVKGAGDPITEFSAKVDEDWQENAQDGGLVTSILIHLLEAGDVDGALIATESDDDPWKAESFLATTPEELIANAGSVYNQTMALGNLDLEQWEHKLDGAIEDASLALVGTPCEIEGLRALQDFEWDYGGQEEGVRAIEYTIALMCTKNFNYERLIGEQLEEKRGITPDEIGKMDVLDGRMMVYDRDGDQLLDEDVAEFHDAALKGCDECADFTGYAADLTVGSVGSSDDFSSVIVRTEQGLDAWKRTRDDLVYHDLEDRSAVGKLQSWDKKKAFDSLERAFDPDAPRFIDYADHAENYGTELNPHEAGH